MRRFAVAVDIEGRRAPARELKRAEARATSRLLLLAAVWPVRCRFGGDPR
jgi:hypothetical protein